MKPAAKDTPLGMPRPEWEEYEEEEPTNPSPKLHKCYCCGKPATMSRHGVPICNACDEQVRRKR